MGSTSKNGGGIVVEEAAAEEVQQQMVLEQQNGGVGNGGLYVKVMTDEQMELLRRQISVYATICEQLVEMHKAMSAHQDSLAGMRMGNMYCDPLMASAGHKITARQRWTPSQMQLQILESIFEQGTGTPSKQKIKDITSELSEHGPISETNVYNWFQNRRARSKRKQQVAASNNGESEVETEADSPKEKKTKSENIHSNDNAAFYADDLGFQSQEVNSNTCDFDLDIGKMHRGFQGNDGFRPSGSLANISFFDANPRLDHFMGNLDIPAGFNSFRTTEGFDMIG